MRDDTWEEKFPGFVCVVLQVELFRGCYQRYYQVILFLVIGLLVESDIELDELNS